MTKKWYFWLFVAFCYLANAPVKAFSVGIMMELFGISTSGFSLLYGLAGLMIYWLYRAERKLEKEK